MLSEYKGMVYMGDRVEPVYSTLCTLHTRVLQRLRAERMLFWLNMVIGQGHCKQAHVLHLM